MIYNDVPYGCWLPGNITEIEGCQGKLLNLVAGTFCWQFAKKTILGSLKPSQLCFLLATN
jgi:hypothetical protein